MIIYIEKQAKNYPQTQNILEKFKSSQVIYVDHYKNIFDKNYKNINSKKSLIIAKLNSTTITEAPPFDF
jgi:spore photoproduct lyase